MTESRIGGEPTWGRIAVVAVVAAVAVAGMGTFAIGGSSAAYAGDAGDWSPHPGKEVTPECPPTNETTPDNASNETGNETDDSGYQLVINYTGAWQGTIVTNDTNIPIEGTGDERIDIEADEDERIAATVSKANVTDETMGVTLLLNGLVIDEQRPVEPTVDNFDDADDGQADSTSSDSAFAGTSDADPADETSTNDDWETFGEENEASSFEDDAVTAEDDPFGDSNDTEAATSTDSAFATENGDVVTDNANDTDGANGTNDTEAANATADDCVTEENTTQPTDNNTSLAIETDEEAQVVFADQDLTGSSVVVESATVPDSGFVVIHNMSMMEGESVERSVIGVSDKLDAQRSEDIEINLADDVEESQTLIAVVYRDSDDDGEFEFGDDGEIIDEPYRDDEGAAVADVGYVTIPGDGAADAGAFDEGTTTATATAQDTSVFADEPTTTYQSTESATVTATATASATDTPQAAVSGNAEQSTETNAPGFGIGVAIVALLGSALLATRRF